MNFHQAVETVLFRKYATFSGRASVKEYLMFMGFCGCVFFLLVVTLGISAYKDPTHTSTMTMIAAVVTGIATLGLALPSFALTVRRFHDAGFSGWIVVALSVLQAIPFAGIIFSLALIVVSLTKGTEGPNRYGDMPTA